MSRERRMADEPVAFDLETLAEAVNYGEWIYAAMRPCLGQRVLEVGCGSGNLTPLFLREGRSVLAIDPGPQMIAAHRKIVGTRPGLTVRQAVVQELVAEFAGSFDSVVSSNVLEHLPDEAEQEAVRAMHALLKAGGAAVHWVPAGPWVYGSLDRVFGHCRRYSRARLRAAFEQAGFRVERCRYWNSVGLLGWWWYGRVLKRERLSRRATLLYDRCVVPVLRRVEGWLWLPAGQSLCIVARKA